MDYSPSTSNSPFSLPRLTPGLLLLALLAMTFLAAGCAHHAAAPDDSAKLETAEDLYRQARTIEDRVASSPREAQANLQQARVTYIRALQRKPSPTLEAYIRAGLGNVAFYQDDYSTAINQWAQAFDRLDDPNLRAMTLYRMGMAEQRVGRFEQADRTFLSLQEQYPNTSAAQLSRTKYGARAFYLQLAVFTQPALADKAILQLYRQHLSPSRLTDNQGRQVVRLGPFPTYTDALRTKLQLSTEYPGSVILP